MADTWIGWIALIVVALAFQRMTQINRVMIAILRLQGGDPVAILGNGVRVVGPGRCIARVDFGAEERAAQCPEGLVGCVPGAILSVRLPKRVLVECECLRIAPVIFAAVLFSEFAEI